MSNNNNNNPGGDNGGGGTNPFDFDVDFDKVQKRRQQYLARKAAERGEPLLNGMDKDGDDDNNNNTGGTSSQNQQPKGRFSALNFLNKSRTGGGGSGSGDSTSQKGGGGGKGSGGNVTFSTSSKSTNNNNNNNIAGGGGGGGETINNAQQQQQQRAAANAANTLSSEQEKKDMKEAGLVGIFAGKKIIRWPYDDYHEVQKQYYVKLEEDEQQQAIAVAAKKARERQGNIKNGGSEDSDDSVGGGGDNNDAPAAATARRGFFGFGGGGNRADSVAAATSLSQESVKKDLLLQRPEDPPDIPTAVQGLSLSEFERKAESRAISIVSTWLFDCGLIDELLVHGGMGKSTMRTAQKHYTTNNDLNKGIGGDNLSLGETDSKTTHDTSKYSNPSVKTSEGIEVGQFGHIIEGPSKMDNEIAKLRNGTSRQLTMVNSRLNDGVAASGGEVQELVNAVNSTKDDLHRLRELSTYIGGVANDVSTSSVGGNGSVTTTGGGSGSAVKNNMMARSQTFMLTKYPKLKKAINARRNLARCFRELDFYSQIPVTCDRLREDLHQAEWTEMEWNSLREVSCEHVELEIFLVEAEAAMKVRIDEEFQEQKNLTGDGGGIGIGDGMDTSRRSHLRRLSTGNNNNSFNDGGGGGTGFGGANISSMMNYEEVDNFLHEHVKNVWELGDEIRMRIMSGIGSAFELGTNNPAGLVALVEAVEVYETANEEYKDVHGEEAGGTGLGSGKSGGGSKINDSMKSNSTMQNLRFTDMRASALKQMYQDFELRGLEIFREVHEVAQARGIEIGDEEEQEEATEYFNAILRAANELTAEIAFVQNQMSPCFPANWALEMLWSTCVAHVCSKQILDQIGGTEGHKLPDLTVTQLLDLVAWIESFRSTIEETFPNIGEHISKKTYFNKRPDLLQEDHRGGIDMDLAKDSLAWANNMLWEVHDLAKDEFLFRTKEQTNEWLDNVYDADHTKNQSAEGILTTSLCEDVYALAGVQLRTIQERLTRRSEALVQAVGVIFKNLYEKQIACRNNFLLDFERCCAASNDFIRMSENCEEILADLLAESNLSEEASNQLDEQSGVLLGLYSNDAVFAAQKVHIYIFEPIDEAISEELFGEEWLNELTANELTLTMVKTLEDFMGDLEVFLDDLMVGKTLDALVTATVIFYLKYFLKKVATHKDNKRPLWSDNHRALERMRGDIDTMKGYFEDLMDLYPALNRVVPEQFEILETFHELLSIAAGISQSSDRDFVILLQKRIRNIPITKLVVGDIWHAMNPTAEKDIYEKIDVMENELTAVAPDDAEAFDVALARQTVPGLRLDQELARLCDENKRNRPGYNRTAAEQGNVMLSKWRETWQNLVDEAKE